MTKNNSLFIDFLGDYPIIRILDFLIENDLFDYSKKDICRYANVSWNTLQTFWEKLEEKDIIVYTRKVGKASLYKLNKENPLVQELIKLDEQLMKASLEKIEEKQALKVTA